jgi:hypothetical protein
MLIKASEIQHCTRTIGKPGQYGIAIFLHSNLLEWWKPIMNDIEKMQRGVRLGEKETKRATMWLDNNNTYQSYLHI